MNSPLTRARSLSLRLFVTTVAAVAAAGAQTRPQPIDPRPAPGLLERADVRQDVLTVQEEVSTATISRVDDGDSVVAREGNESIGLHLDGVDAPELSQPFGMQARDYLSTLVMNRSVSVRVKGRAARQGESRARIELNGADVSLLLVRNGLARYCGLYSDDAALRQAETEAQKAGRGLWAVPEAPSPWQHRGVRHCWQERPE